MLTAGATLAIGGVISPLIAYSAEPRGPVTRIGSESDVVTSSASEPEPGYTVEPAGAPALEAGYTVENFQHPGAGRIAVEFNILLKEGDGNIVHQPCDPLKEQIAVESSTGDFSRDDYPKICFGRAHERESFLRHVGSLLERSEKEADAAHFWIGVFRTAIDENPHRPLRGAWYLMLGIAHISTEENFEELAELTESPSYLPDMINAYDLYFVKSKHPLVPELLRRLMEPEDLYHPGQIAYGATLAANRKFIQLIPTIEKLRERLSREDPAHPTISKVDDALFRLRRAEYVQDTRSADSDVLLVDLEAGDLQRVAFAANALGARKVVAALPRLRELMESDDLTVRREAKLAVTKLEKAQAP
ncbi:hypothetical protein ACI2IX_10905 [Leifsonia aquatica]|uniref:hypothetical protein n=1 Tax=Leifsonia aquatica TaxID=144185 RepID=UPI00384F2A96